MLFPQGSALPYKACTYASASAGCLQVVSGSARKRPNVKTASGVGCVGCLAFVLFFFFLFPFLIFFLLLPRWLVIQKGMRARPRRAQRCLLLPAEWMLVGRCASGARRWNRATQRLRSKQRRRLPLPGRWGGAGRRTGVWLKGLFYPKWLEEARAELCVHTCPSSPAAAGGQRGRAAVGSPEAGMLAVPAAGTNASTNRDALAAPRIIPAGLRAGAGASLSLCGTPCGGALGNPRTSSGAARGSGAQRAAGHPRCRWAGAEPSQLPWAAPGMGWGLGAVLCWTGLASQCSMVSGNCRVLLEEFVKMFWFLSPGSAAFEFHSVKNWCIDPSPPVMNFASFCSRLVFSLGWS